VIRETISLTFPHTFLVTAEIASCDIKNHCYLTLIERDDETIRAEIKAVIWSSRYNTIASMFEEETGMKLTKGIKILFEAEVDYHERYGLKLIIHNIDPSYTIGEMAVRRREILERLRQEGLIDLNKSLPFPLVPQRIGIISSSNAAGYEDLINHLKGNPYGYKFYWRLYDALMQGDHAEESILEALSRCARDVEDLDLVVIVRGGGGETDLSCFDSYEIGRAIALFPIPVVAGIGHHRDISIVDEVAHTRVKTPTAVADMIITRVKEFDDRLENLRHAIVRGMERLTTDLNKTLFMLYRRLETSCGRELMHNIHKLAMLSKGLTYSTRLLQSESKRLDTLEMSVSHLNPFNVLKRGYSITYYQGRALKSITQIPDRAEINTLLYEGEILSQITEKKKTGRSFYE
jgi:exodeoxyribonuclease VII large subunit